MSVSRVSCKETLVGMRCEQIGRQRVVGGRDTSRETKLFASTSDGRRQNANPFPSSRALPLRPLLLLRHPPPPATARIQSLHINPAHNSHFPVWATLRLRLPRYPPVERAKGNQNKQGKEEPVRWWAEKGGKGIAASYRLGFLSKPGF